MTKPPERVTLDVALRIVNSMIRFAKRNMMPPGSYAVADAGGHVVAFERRDPAPPATADIAIDKAWTAATMRVSGRMLEVITRGQGWRLNVKHKGRLTVIPGTVPIVAHGRVVGGIGHSGGSAEDDLKIAQEGLAAFYREEPVPVEPVEPDLTLARRIAEKAMEAVRELKLPPVSIAVVDAYGELILLYRMDGAPYGTLELARNKAWTAAAFKTDSEKARRFCDGPWCNVNWNERFLPIPGGVYLEHGEGYAIGVAGADPETDKKIAHEALRRAGLG